MNTRTAKKIKRYRQKERKKNKKLNNTRDDFEKYFLLLRLITILYVFFFCERDTIFTFVFYFFFLFVKNGICECQ